MKQFRLTVEGGLATALLILGLLFIEGSPQQQIPSIEWLVLVELAADIVATAYLARMIREESLTDSWVAATQFTTSLMTLAGLIPIGAIVVFPDLIPRDGTLFVLLGLGILAIAATPIFKAVLFWLVHRGDRGA